MTDRTRMLYDTVWLDEREGPLPARAVRIIGGWLHGGRYCPSPPALPAEALSLQIVSIGDSEVAVPLHWPVERAAEGVAFVRIYGADENGWPDAVAEDFLGLLPRKDKNPH